MLRTENKVYYDSEDPESSMFRINKFPGGKKMLKNVTGFIRICDLSGELKYDIIDGKFLINNPLTGREDEYDIPIILEKEEDLVLSRSYARFNYNSIKKSKLEIFSFCDELKDCENKQKSININKQKNGVKKRDEQLVS